MFIQLFHFQQDKNSSDPIDNLYFQTYLNNFHV